MSLLRLIILAAHFLALRSYFPQKILHFPVSPNLSKLASSRIIKTQERSFAKILLVSLGSLLFLLCLRRICSAVAVVFKFLRKAVFALQDSFVSGICSLSPCSLESPRNSSDNPSQFLTCSLNFLVLSEVQLHVYSSLQKNPGQFKKA